MSTYWITQNGVDIKLYNLNFAIYGPAKNHDLAITEIREPASGAELNNAQNVKVFIQNHGLNNIATGDYKLHYRINGGAWTDLENGPAIASGDEVVYSFHAKADLSEKGTYHFEVELQYDADENSIDNSLNQVVENYGTIYASVPNTKVVYHLFGYIHRSGRFGDVIPPIPKIL
jgi:hypothetical protein